jgi:hypothetical protein
MHAQSDQSDATVEFPAVEALPVRTRRSWRLSGHRRVARPPVRRNRAIGIIAGAVLVVGGIFGSGAGLGLVVGAPALPSLSFAHPKPTGAAADAMSRSVPTRISIPAIGVTAPIMAVGLAADGTIATPPLANSNLAGWYEGGPAPGQNGPAVVVGHVDGPHGESIFYKLGKLKPGDTIQMTLTNRRVAIFSIYSVESYPKGKFPGDRIYGDYTRPGLRLITCGGAFVGGSTGYADNVVVYATLKYRG